MEKNSRAIFIETLSALAERDPGVMLVVCDVGFSYIEDFAQRFPKQFLNLGVTEQSATGVSAGLAYAGTKPYLYSMVNFILMRNYEQVRNDICFGNANVKIIGVKGSAAYKFLGFSHNLVDAENEEDLLKNLPNIRRHYPETKEVENLIRQEYLRSGPAYIRL